MGKVVKTKPAADDSVAVPRAENRPLLHVLIVEDDLDSREGLKNLLEIWGHSVDLADNGRDGIEQAILHRPAVALIDIGLPGLDGYQVARRIRAALGSSEMFLVAITGYADAGERARALENGFDAHLPKPIDFSRLSSLLETVATAHSGT